MKYFSYILLVLVFGTAGINAQGPVIKTSIDTNQIVIGDQTRLKYQVEQPNGVQLIYPMLTGEFTSGVEVVGNPVLDSTRIKDDGWLKSIEYTITSFDTGMYYLPPVPFLFDNNGKTDTLYSAASYLEVFGVAIDTTNTIRDIKAAEKIPVTFLEVMGWLLPIGVLIGLLIFVLWYFKNKEKDEAEFTPDKPDEPAYITALRELDRLKAKKLWQQKQEKEYYSQITHIIRWYIEKRYHVDALEKTSDEILAARPLKILDKTTFENLEKLLNLADLVKFAKGEPTAEENMKHLDNAFTFIKLTREEPSGTTDQVITTDG